MSTSCANSESSRFSLKSYREIMTRFLETGYEVVPLGTELRREKTISLRHDIDFSPVPACRVAQVNSELGISSCFMIMPNNPLYNLRSDECVDALLKIGDLGQRIGLHFCLPGKIKISTSSLADVHARVHKDFDYLESVTDIPVDPVMSWHNPSVLGHDYNEWIHTEIDGILNAYSLNQDQVPYYADSNHRYSVEEWMAIADRGHPALHLNFHPAQWSLRSTRSMEEVLSAILHHTLQKSDAYLMANHVYKERLPNGIPSEDLLEYIARILES